MWASRAIPFRADPRVPSVDCIGRRPESGGDCDSAPGVTGTVPGMLRLGAILIVLALSVAACGSDDDGGSASSSSSSATTQSTSTGGGTQNASAEGKTVFTANCKGCHTLQDAGATGSVGPNLDELQPDKAAVQRQVENGGGPMPAFKGKLSAAQIDAVSTYVSTVAGQS
jgi:mono/diheme cytochrome c family protein